MLLAGKLRRFALAERERSGRRVGELSHAARHLRFLEDTVAEYEEAIAALLANIEQQEAVDASPESELFAEGGRLGNDVHRRVETFAALSRLLLERLDELLAREPVPAELRAEAQRLADLVRGGDLRVVSAEGRRVRTTILAESGDAELAVEERDVDVDVDVPLHHHDGSDELTLRGWLARLEDHVGATVDWLEATRGRTESRP